MEIIEIIKATDGLIAVTVMLYFGTKLVNQIDVLQKNQQDIVLKLIELCADAEDKK